MLVLLELGHWCKPERVAAAGRKRLGPEEVMDSEERVGCWAWRIGEEERQQW